MIVTPLTTAHIGGVEQLITLSGPYVRPRTPSDYWLYAELFADTCPIALADGQVIGVVIALRSQVKPDDVYIQDVAVHPSRRRRGIARRLLDAVYERTAGWACRRLYLTSEPDNHTANATWHRLGYTNLPGDYTTNGVSVICNYKGPGKDRAVYQRIVA